MPQNEVPGSQVAALTAAVNSLASAMAAQTEAIANLIQQLSSGVITVKGTVKQS